MSVNVETFERIKRNASNRYQIGTLELHCGDCFELGWIRREQPIVWIPVRVEHDSNGYYLVAPFGNVTQFGNQPARLYP